MKQKLNKLNYLVDFMKNWCEPNIDPNKLNAQDKKNLATAREKGEENGFKLKYSISKFLGLKQWEFSTLAKGINRGLGANKLHKPSLIFF